MPETTARSLRFYPLNAQGEKVIHKSFPHGGKLVITGVDKRWIYVHNGASSLIFSGKLQKLKDVDNSPIVGGLGGICTMVDILLP